MHHRISVTAEVSAFPVKDPFVEEAMQSLHAYGTIVCVQIATLFFAQRVSCFSHVVPVTHPNDDTCIHAVPGVLFFASNNDLMYQFDYTNDPKT